MPHGTATQLVLYRPSIIIIIYLQFQFKQFNETRGLERCPARECRFSRVTSSFHTLSAVCCGKLLVFIQYIISIQSRFYVSPVYTFWCLVLIFSGQKPCTGIIQTISHSFFTFFKGYRYNKLSAITPETYGSPRKEMSNFTRIVKTLAKF